MSINTSNAGRPRWRNPQMLVMLITGGPHLDQRRSVMIRMISDDLKWVWVFPDLGRGRGWAYRSVDEAEIEDSSTTMQCCVDQRRATLIRDIPRIEKRRTEALEFSQNEEGRRSPRTRALIPWHSMTFRTLCQKEREIEFCEILTFDDLSSWISVL